MYTFAFLFFKAELLFWKQFSKYSHSKIIRLLILSIEYFINEFIYIYIFKVHNNDTSLQDNALHGAFLALRNAIFQI